MAILPFVGAKNYYLWHVGCCSSDIVLMEKEGSFSEAEYSLFWPLVFSALFLNLLFLNNLKYKNICFFSQLKENPVVTQYDSIFL